MSGTFENRTSRVHRVRRGDDDLEYRVIRGDSREVVPRIADGSVDLVVTSPPYFQQREYSSPGLGGEKTVGEYLDNILETLREVAHAMKPSGNIVYNMGDKIAGGGFQMVPYRFAIRAVDELGLRLVNDITWVKSNPTPHQFARRLVNSTEPFFHFALSGDYYHDRSAFQPAEKARRGKPTPKLGSRYRSLIETSDLSGEERKAAHEALDHVISEVRDGAIHSFRMKIRGIHAPAYGGQSGGRKMHIERDGFTVIRISGEPMKKDVIESPVSKACRATGTPPCSPFGLSGR